ncbi:kynureninase [Polyangium aurulentum]|uniref:kynureninase n=1 Tax=Polyangium aurulentum TaxID=2567896 RepID=UPI0010AE8ACA|nr:kynureninase [Polyangium aurulentum]UQA57296.1 kynureninase [Polyangium aurulentum]
MLDRQAFEALDRADPLGGKRSEFLVPEGLVYLDGNSLGALPARVPARLERVVREEWGRGLIGSWNASGWIDLPRCVGAKIARLVGAGADEVIACDSTSVNLFKVLAAALGLLPERRVIVSDGDNFPTDLYVAEGVRDLLGRGHEMRLVDAGDIEGAIDEGTALLLLTGVDYRTGALHDMERLTRAAHDKGALVVWDLAHSAGAMPLDLDGLEVDFAVGCGYKYLNGGPGAPAFVFVARRHLARVTPALTGWMGHRAPFAFDARYAPSDDIRKLTAGTPPVLAMAALDEALEVFADVDLRQVREKSARLGDLFISLADPLCKEHGLRLVSPRDSAKRGSQVAFAHPEGYAIVQALIESGVVGDFRAPDVMRFGFAPLYLRYVDIFDAAERLAAVLREERWRDPRFRARAAVT